jgi:EpsI family protein
MKNWSRVTVSTVLLLSTYCFLQLRSTGEAVPIRQRLEYFPQTIANWQGQEDAELESEVMNILKLQDYLMRRYVDTSGKNLWLYIGYWDTQRKGAQIHSPKHCLPGGGWEPLEVQRVLIPLNQGEQKIEANRYVLQKERSQQVVTYWYHSQGAAIAGEIDAKVQLVKNAILHNRTDGALVRLTSPVSGSIEDTFQRHVQYIQAMYPLLSAYLPN